MKNDLQTLSWKELDELAAALRKRIIEVMSVNGGHLSSNLGIVELTIALHLVFDSPIDKFIFDVSHQCYPHKLLTGRADRFHEIRKYKGLCGFAHPKESEHDHFFAGHAGTALSLALGMARGRDLDKSRHYVIPILGDASLTCGLTLEALNNVSKKIPRFIAILNDNDMSISENVGNIKHILKNPGSFFENFGFSYVGPVDGHNIQTLVETFKKLKERDHPVLIHVMTVKGKGMTVASDNPTPYHGVKPFDLCSGKFLPAPSNKPTFPKIFGRHILQMGQNYPDLVCITPAMPAGSCMDDFMKRFPERCFDVGIAEGHAVTFAGGLAKTKKKVICCIYATFLQRAFDNLFQDVCMQELPVIFALDRSFISGPDGSTHHGIYDIAFLNAMPNMIIAQPRNGHVLKELFDSSLNWGKPTAIRYPNLETEEPPLPIQSRSVGKGEILEEGKDLLLMGLGHTVYTCLQVRELLLQKGIVATVVDPVFLKPLDTELIQDLVSSHRFLVTVEEHSLNGGLAMIINNFLIQNGHKDLEVINIGVPDRWVQFGSNSEIMRELGLDAESIAKRLLQECYDHYPISQRKEKALL